MHNHLYSLYIHWPFCSKKCYYCDFVALEQHGDYQEQYHHALIKEINDFAQQMADEDRNISTVFIGGGTPSLYPPELLEELFTTLKQHFNFAGIKEISLEANPADITEEKLDAWLEVGISRISVGVQVLDDDVLLKLNRRQRIIDVHKTFQLAPKYFNNLSLDLILGLPGVSEETWHNTIQQAVVWPINHLSLYFLTVHEKTPLYFKVQTDEMKLHDDDMIISLYEKTLHTMSNAGFERYEISNFAKPGFASLHNQGYWNRKQYQGFGIGASSFDGKQRLVNEKNLVKYIEAIDQGNFDQLAQKETLSPEQEKLEMLMLGLRQQKGIELALIERSFNHHEKKRFFENMTLLKEQSFIQENNGYLSLTLKGILLENEVVLKLF
jgi:oxygen-independent coproporphyrinogen III oxidase